jgi:Na+/proline symporter
MTPPLACLPPVCMMLASLFLVGLVLALGGMVKDPPPDPNAPAAAPSTFPGWWVALLIAAGVAALMGFITLIAAPV